MPPDSQEKKVFLFLKNKGFKEVFLFLWLMPKRSISLFEEQRFLFTTYVANATGLAKKEILYIKARYVLYTLAQKETRLLATNLKLTKNCKNKISFSRKQT